MRKKEGLKLNSIFFQSIMMILTLVVVTIFVALSFSDFKRENREQVKSRNEEYIKEFTLSLISKLNESFDTYQTSVAALADMMKDNLYVDDKLPRFLDNLEDETQFDHVRFVDEDGISHTSLGTTADVSDRTYYIEGMKGNSGTTFVTDSRLTNQRQIGFYAPVRDDNNDIKGVMVVFCDEQTLEKRINYWFYGEKSSAGIITTNGEMIVNSPSEALQKVYKKGISENINELIERDFVDEQTKENIRNAYTNKEETYFELSWDEYTTIGYLAPLESVDLNVYMTFPHDVSKEMYESGVAAGIKLQIRLIIIFICLAIIIIFMGIYRIHKEKVRSSLYRERANTDELTGLYNRRAYENEMDLYRDKELPDDIVYVEFDVNGLKMVNDTIGHISGDELIIRASFCLKKCFDKYGKVFRTGGDEFVAIIFANATQLQALKEEFAFTVRQVPNDNVIPLKISCGYVSKSDVEIKTIKEMSLLADKRMYEEKAEYYKNNNVDRRARNNE